MDSNSDVRQDVDTDEERLPLKSSMKKKDFIYRLNKLNLTLANFGIRVLPPKRNSEISWNLLKRGENFVRDAVTLGIQVEESMLQELGFVSNR